MHSLTDYVVCITLFYRCFCSQHYLAYNGRALLVFGINPTGVIAAMVLSSAVGLYSYFAINFYVDALVGTFISIVIVPLSTWLWPRDFNWNMLRPHNETTSC